jgi:hypothetical protein
VQNFRALYTVDICRQIFLHFVFLQFCTRIYYLKVSFVNPTVKSGSRGFTQNLFRKFWTFLQVSINFRSLKRFLEFKTIEKHLNPGHSIGPKPARGYSPRVVAGCYARSARKPAGSRPGSPAQRGKRLARPAATRARRRGHHAQTTRRTARWRTRRWLDGGKVLPEILRGPQGGCRARKRGQGHIGTEC